MDINQIVSFDQCITSSVNVSDFGNGKLFSEGQVINEASQKYNTFVICVIFYKINMKMKTYRANAR